MKTMLKADFIKLVNDLLAAGHTPELDLQLLSRLGYLVWTVNGVKHVEAIYPAAEKLQTTFRNMGRFRKWFTETTMAFHAAAAEKLNEGDLVMWGATVWEVTAIRTALKVERSPNGTPKNGYATPTGKVVLDDSHEVMAGELRAIEAGNTADFEALVTYGTYNAKGDGFLQMSGNDLYYVMPTYKDDVVSVKVCACANHAELVRQRIIYGDLMAKRLKAEEDFQREQQRGEQAAEAAVDRWFEDRGYGY
ncbi:hypothetical protein NAD41_000908 [Salmonella enterica]|nr:hypothetical protein [Salmonella enterica]EKK6596292.1 hypothetical protein [Salmonella enterica]